MHPLLSSRLEQRKDIRKVNLQARGINMSAYDPFQREAKKLQLKNTIRYEF